MKYVITIVSMFMLLSVASCNLVETTTSNLPIVLADFEWWKILVIILGISFIVAGIIVPVCLYKGTWTCAHHPIDIFGLFGLSNSEANAVMNFIS